MVTGYAITPALTKGLSFDGTTGIISGTPTAASPAINYTVSGFNIAGSSSANVNVTVIGAPCITYSGPQVYSVNKAITPLSPTNNCGAVPITTYGKVTTLAGSGAVSYIDNTNGALASFNHLYGAVTDAAGNLYVADNLNYVIRKITPAGAVSTFAGSGIQGNVNANGKSASFGGPIGITIDNSGNLFVLDYQRSIDNCLLKKITPLGDVSTVMTIQGLALAVDAQNNIYVTGNTYNQVFKISPSGITTEITGNGGFNGPTGIAVDKLGNVYIADRNNNQIKKMTPAGVWSVLAGSGAVGYADGTGTSAVFQNPSSVAVDASGNVYVADQNVYTGGQVTSALIRKITPQGVVTTIAGKMGGPLTGDGVGAAAGLGDMVCLALDTYGNLYSTETTIIRKIVVTGYAISPNLPSGLILDSSTGIISGTPKIASPTIIYTITGFNLAGSSSATVNITVNNLPPCIMYATPQAYTVNKAILPLQPTNNCGAVPAENYHQVLNFAGSATGVPGNTNSLIATQATFNLPNGMVYDADGNLYVAEAQNNIIRKIDPSGAVTTFAGSGVAGFTNTDPGNPNPLTASFNWPISLAIDGLGNLYVGDIFNNAIRKINLTTKSVSTYAIVHSPSSIAIDPNATILYATDYDYNYVYKVTNNGASIVSVGTPTSFNAPRGVVLDSKLNAYIADQNNNQIKMVTPAGVISVYAGSGTPGDVDDVATNATFAQPCQLAFDAQGNLYVAEFLNQRIRKISPAKTGSLSIVTTTAAYPGYGPSTSIPLSIWEPGGLLVDMNGDILYSQPSTNNITKVILSGYNINPVLPAGLTFDSTTGTISGTPTAASTATNYTVTGYNSAGSSIATINIAVNVATAKTAALLALTEPTVNTAPYPMPFTSTLNINIGDTEITNLTVKIFDSGSGKQVYLKQFNNQSGVLTLDVTNLNKGIYSLHLEYQNQQKVFKIFK